MHQTDHRTAVAILNWNGVHFLRQFLPSVVQHSRSFADIYVIDNASTDESIAFLAAEYPEIAVIPLSHNFGFAGGYNRGLMGLSHEYVILLNSDVEVTNNWIQPVVQWMDQNPDMAACQPKILDYHNKHLFEYAGGAGGFMDKDGFAFCAGRIFFEFEEDRGQFNSNEEVFWASGAAMFVRLANWQDVGGLDEDFFAHMEEIDLCWRFKNRGLKIGACRESTVFHYGGGTLDRQSTFKTYLNFRNSLYLIVKNERQGNLAFNLIRRLILDGIAGMRFVVEGKFSHCWAVIRAHFSFYKRLVAVLDKRKRELRFSSSPNLTGRLNRSIVWLFFIKKIKSVSQLNPSDFL
jgi:GT2 family glycosyltransferase